MNSETRLDCIRTVALAGNPNVGKSTLFNALTGLRQHTGNWPGKTVASARGHFTSGGREYELVDLPGTYSLFSHSPEEEIAREFLASGSADAAIVVCDATCPERGLRLALQTMSLTRRVVVCMNLLDEAKRSGVQLDLAALEHELGVPVIGMTARSGKGVDRVAEAVERVLAAPETEFVPPPSDDPAATVAAADELCRSVTLRRGRDTRTEKLDHILTGRRFGIPAMLLLLLGVLWLTVCGASYPSQLLSDLLIGFEEPLHRLITHALGEGVADLLAGGVYRTLAWVVSVMLPPMAVFFPLFTLLEDFGYLPRIAFNLDNCLRRAGACGKQALTMCMGLGCNAVGVTGCRIIDSPRERLIAILTNCFMPCNGRFPILITLAAIFFAASGFGGVTSALVLAAAILLGIAATLLTSYMLSHTILRGKPSFFTLELPPYRVPQVGRVIVRSVLDRTVRVLGRAVVCSAPAGLVLWLLANVDVGGASLLKLTADALDPAARVMGMDGVILLAFILAIPANEIVIPVALMGYLSAGSLVSLESTAALGELLRANGWTAVTALCVMVFSLMHWPCATTLLTIRRETGSLRWTALAALLPTVLGAALCALINGAATLIRLIA